MEKLFYEIKPFLCMWLGYAAITNPIMLRMGRIPATALILCALMMLFWRMSYRGFLGQKQQDKFHK
ncbi:MAG: hypothetical protein AB7F86_03025 [Bdellovibrionales bacterium]